MNKDSARKKIESLRHEINKHNVAYYVLDNPEISDAQYDKLIRNLEGLEKEFPDLITPDSPTQRVGAPPLDVFEKATHTEPLLSLSNAFSEQEFLDFDQRVKNFLKTTSSMEYVVEPKYDGSAVELIYEKGLFTKGSTRGDGVTGEDITQNLKTIRSIPLRLLSKSKIPKHLSVRGEVLIGLDDFKKLNIAQEKEGKPLFANPRNAAAGSLRQLDSQITAKRPLSLYCYSLAKAEPLGFSSQDEILKALGNWGFRVTPQSKVCRSTKEVLAFYEKMKGEREKLPYEIDGVVVKVNSIKWQTRLGAISKSPRWAVAFKLPAQQETTVIEEIVVQVGRTGALTPVAHLKPVKVGGVEVRRATLHNQDEIDRKDIRIGDHVVVQRAGDVIPEVVKVMESKRKGKEKKFKMPLKCPICSAEVERPEDEAVHRCTSFSCPAQLKNRISHFASKGALDIDGLGTKLVYQLVDRGLVNEPADLYKLDLKTLADLERMAEKSGKNILEALNKSKETTLDRFLFGLGIRHVGSHASKLLAREFPQIESLYHVQEEDLISIHEIGPEMAKSIVRFFHEKQNREQIKKLIQYGVQLHVPKKGKSKKLEGKTFVFTGSLTKFTREEAQRQVEDFGGRASSSVSRSTDFVVAGVSVGSKLEKAKAFGVKILSEDEFLRMVK